ncbi:MarR family winged helix-turn-helix transcriptional regulator [Myceligenerans xiligouense]|uniref:MarR family transcriptional regulator n=1 Tax=Myceligenerans xiligouense TaxID=253184 RepID=A0A3N4ZNT6_9MICO|nr:MarR family winged helix-turn-helix transcriptional regulator [Myceligenerans xiligouense]RPF21531.1 MarR family transcriptional regulator [Myceligenerans xiligouense]
MTSELRTAPPLTSDTAFLLARANANSLATAHAALADHGLRVRSYTVLALAAAEERRTQRNIADLLRLDPSQVVALVDDLQRRGLVTREPDPADRRAKVVVATTEGRRLHATAADAAHDAARELLTPLDDTERELLRDLLHRLAFPT